LKEEAEEKEEKEEEKEQQQQQQQVYTNKMLRLKKNEQRICKRSERSEVFFRELAGGKKKC
jgi:hypothetical protein